MALTKITNLNSGGGFTSGDVTRVFRNKCSIYVAKGAFDSGNKPSKKSDVTGLYADSGGSFIPLGHMAEETGTISWEQQPIAIDFGTIAGPTKVMAEFKSIMVNPDMVDWLNGEDAKGALSFLFVPDGDDGSVFLAISDVKITNKGNISLKGDLSTIDINVEEEVNNLTDKLLFSEFTT